jgi:DNA-binding FadR family transcriptional regulator
MAASANRTATTPATGKPVMSAEIYTLLERIAGTSPVDIMAVRLMVEPHAAAQAAASATSAELAVIRNCHDRAAAETDANEFEKRDAEFHAQIFLATRNELLASLHDILRVIRNQPSWVEIKRRSASDERRRTYCAEHGQIVKALMNHDPDAAAQAMRAHLLTVNQNLFGNTGLM